MDKRQLAKPGPIDQGIRNLTAGVLTMQRREAIQRWAARVGLFLGGALVSAMALSWP